MTIHATCIFLNLYMLLITMIGTVKAVIVSPTRGTLAMRIQWLTLYSGLWNPMTFVDEERLKWLVRPGTIDMTAIGRYEDHLQSVITFNKDMVFLDIGAAVGHYSIRATKAGAIVHAWKPVKQTRQVLQANIQLNGLDKGKNLIVHAEALGTSGTVRIEEQSGSMFVGGGDEVEMRTLDSYNMEKVDLVKIDVEGMETDVLEGAVQTLSTLKPKVAVEIHPFYCSDSESRCRAFLEQIGYTSIQTLHPRMSKNYRPYLIAMP